MLEFGYNTKSPSVIDSYKVNMSFYLSLVVVAPGSSVLPSIHKQYSVQHTPAVFNAMKLKQTETITSFTGIPSLSADLSCAHRTPVFLSVSPYPKDVGLSLLTPNAKFE